MTYWKPEPKRHAFAWWALLVPAIIYSAGVIVYAHNAFVPNAAMVNGHSVGSALMVLGGEAGTLAAAAEVFRKQASKQANALDWAGLIVSLVATLGNLFVVYVALATLEAPWVAFVRKYGAMVLLLCSGVDFYAGIMEFGFYNASFDARWEAWNDARHTWEAIQQGRSAKADAKQSAPESAPENAEQRTSAPESEQSAHVCAQCGRTFGSRNALSAHKRFCTAAKAAALAG